MAGKDSNRSKKNDAQNDTQTETPTTLQVKGVDGVEAMAQKKDAPAETPQRVNGHIYTVEYIKTVTPDMGGGDQFFVFRDGTRVAQVVFVNESVEIISGTLDADGLSGAAIAIDQALAVRQGIQPSYTAAPENR